MGRNGQGRLIDKPETCLSVLHRAQEARFGVIWRMLSLFHYLTRDYWCLVSQFDGQVVVRPIGMTLGINPGGPSGESGKTVECLSFA